MVAFPGRVEGAADEAAGEAGGGDDVNQMLSAGDERANRLTAAVRASLDA
ncbi:hypothetical protein ACLQ24_21710 [Micromonospora sp. DT4]